jgi:hypothetical protein
MKAGERALAICREALRRGPLVRHERRWRFARRRDFSNSTVKALLASGEAVRVGERVVGRQHAEAAE